MKVSDFENVDCFINSNQTSIIPIQYNLQLHNNITTAYTMLPIK